ncbi:LacI family DNA-binding transcriptional regulator [Streptomyces sp. WMMB 322]|uniref:LacI family DNA-binding transcriptional regulator n=1 Tax=Streptomyces sp. WMMB 322 TaxID=1286821 RepID=UPI0006E347DB|nr:LacI family DNA-binding transcriptional regulator [Streptomyces sp. WMMB 322]SCK57057.1 transcriptional regulator, LacI family [Streptomyces sp. WMMB 322]
MPRRATIYDVASEAGVSISTVSLALNTPARVSDRTRQRVLQAADRLGYTPKPDAVAKARKGVGRIGVIAPYTSYPSVARRLKGVLQAVAGSPLEVVVFDHPSAARSASPLLAGLPLTGRLDGLIVVSLPLEDSTAERLSGLGLPTVLVDGNRPGFDSVRTDDAEGGRLVAEHLVERGHGSFGFLGESQESDAYVSPGQRRLAGFRAALEDSGQLLPPESVHFTAHGLEQAAAAAEGLLSGPRRPTALFAGDDLLAAGALRAARALGLKVPEDLALAGFDDTDLAGALDLTTVRQPLEESGRAATELLMRRMGSAEPSAVRETTLRLELVRRGST